MPSEVCYVSNEEAKMVVRDKKAIGAALFLSFLLYTLAVFIAECKKTKSVRKKSFEKDCRFLIVTSIGRIEHEEIR